MQLIDRFIWEIRTGNAWNIPLRLSHLAEERGGASIKWILQEPQEKGSEPPAQKTSSSEQIPRDKAAIGTPWALTGNKCRLRTRSGSQNSSCSPSYPKQTTRGKLEKQPKDAAASVTRPPAGQPSRDMCEGIDSSCKYRFLPQVSCSCHLEKDRRVSPVWAD